MSRYSRREFIKTGAQWGAASILTAGSSSVALAAAGKPAQGPNAKVLRVVASANGLRATEKAMELLKSGSDPLDAILAGVNIIEDDPNDMSVGLGGLPNEDGVVELDAAVMHGPTHSAGAVAALRNIRNPSNVARLVMERTNHVLLAGEGALRFAKTHGFKEEDLLTEKSREMWLRWKEGLNENDNWFPPSSERTTAELKQVLYTYGTIPCLALDAKGDLAGATSTSGLSYKIAGRVGDSPIIGAGLYVDNEIGAAGSTGRGESNLVNLGAYSVVGFMGDGLRPEEACLRTLEKVVRTSKLVPRLLKADGKPAFGISYYALNKKGEFGGASMWSGAKFIVNDGVENTVRDCAFLYKKSV